MQIIAHRGLWKTKTEQNTLYALEAAFRSGFGVETDVRSVSGSLYLSHDIIQPEHRPAPFDEFIQLCQKYPTRPVFLNIKEDGLADLLVKYDAVRTLNIVFFDMSVPQLVYFSTRFAPAQLCARVSEYEPYPSGIEFCDWIWVDAFRRELNKPELERLAAYRKKLVFVSPELHGRNPDDYWRRLKAIPQLACRAICTDEASRLSGLWRDKETVAA
ncbi:MAG: hypothetical protein HY537_03305 [Deltaproteobacteria bacterium]|nr:hypothetical protein [Deltaproteobacteria bacterium]